MAFGAVKVALNWPLRLLPFRLLNGDRMLRSLDVGVPERLLARRRKPLAETTPPVQPFVVILPLRSLGELEFGTVVLLCFFLLPGWA